MELSPSWEAANCAATQELPSILWNPKVYYRVQKSTPLVLILSQLDLLLTTPSYVSKIHFNIVHPPTPWSSQWSHFFWLYHEYKSTFPWSMSTASSGSKEATRSFETSVEFQRTTWRYVPKNATLHSHYCENLKSYVAVMIQKSCIFCGTQRPVIVFRTACPWTVF
jgi:hypothetical protein